MSDTFKCPSCGATHRIVPVRADSGWGRAVRDGWQRLHSGDSTAPAQTKSNQPSPTTKIVTPTNARGGFRGAGDDPVVQALVSAGAVGACVLVIGISSEWPLKDVALTTTVTLVGTFAVSWFWLLRFSQGLVSTIEEIFDVDLDGDGHAGTPPVVRVEVTARNGNTRQEHYIDAPVSLEVLRQFTKAILNGISTAEGKWSGTGKPFSRKDYRRFRDDLIQDGYARWNDARHKRQGFALTRAGADAFRQIANPPTPDAETA